MRRPEIRMAGMRRLEIRMAGMSRPEIRMVGMRRPETTTGHVQPPLPLLNQSGMLLHMALKLDLSQPPPGLLLLVVCVSLTVGRKKNLVPKLPAVFVTM